MSPLIRILLRYAIGYLAARGFISASDVPMIADDPELIALIEGAVVAAGIAAVEGFYLLAKRLGWRT